MIKYNELRSREDLLSRKWIPTQRSANCLDGPEVIIFNFDGKRETTKHPRSHVPFSLESILKWIAADGFQSHFIGWPFQQLHAKKILITVIMCSVWFVVIVCFTDASDIFLFVVFTRMWLMPNGVQNLVASTKWPLLMKSRQSQNKISQTNCRDRRPKTIASIWAPVHMNTHTHTSIHSHA